MPDYEVKFETVTVGNFDYTIRSLKDRQQFHDPDNLHEQAGVSPASWPLFGVMWPSAMILADIVDNYELTDLKILELGCGLALASLVAHSRGANVTATDYHPLAGTFLNENVILNHFPPLRFESGHWARINPALGKFDLIIGSDILFEPNHPELLSSFIHRHASDNAIVIIVDPGRKLHGKFTKLMVELGYVATAQRVQSELATRIGFRGKVLTYTKSSIAG